MSINSRSLSPENILYLWEAVRMQKQAPANGAKVLKFMTTELEYQLEEAEDVLTKAVKEGVLISISLPSGSSNGNRTGRRNVETKSYRIPEIEEISVDNACHDWYCYECHTPGELHNCLNCLRAFHLSCKRISPEKPNDTFKVTSNRRRIEPIAESQTQNKVMHNNRRTRERIAEASTRNECEAQEDSNRETDNSSEMKPTLEEITDGITSLKYSSIPTLKCESGSDIKPSENKPDVLFVGQVRPPSSRRRVASINYKSEHSDAEEDDSTNLCTRCRLSKLSNIRDPPNMSLDEVNYLLRFTFERVKSWINNDTFSPLPFSNSLQIPSKKELELVSKLCFKYAMSYDVIDEKIKCKAYSCLTEFQCDLMDLQHCIAILYGTSSAEYEATKYLLSDSGYELMEIRQCRDCYRHSNEKSTPLWFCKPCVLRHELVFAKQSGYSFWPAKVIKVKDNQYDVRYFGANHSRAIVDASNVKPIDADEKQLKVKKTVGYTKAMEELQKHQELLQLPPGKFSYEAERKNPFDISVLTSRSSILKRHDYMQRRSATRSPKVEATKKLPPRSQQTLSKLRQGATKLSNSPVFTMEAESFKDSATVSGKRKRKVHNYAVFENNGHTEDVESTISDYISNKRVKLNAGGNSDKRKSKYVSKRKSAGGKSSSSTPTTSKKSVNTDQVLTSKDDQSSGQDSAISSTQEITLQTKSKAVSKSKTGKGKSEKPQREVVENLRRELEGLRDPSEIQKVALDCFQIEIDKMQKKINQLTQEHNKVISKIKKRQWCHYCEKEAIYYCCWNTAYCSTDCQQKHWQTEHKKTCRRTR